MNTPIENTPVVADAVVIGAGPVGLFQVFELGLLEIRAHVIDSLPFVGGQCIELYPDKPIYDIPAVPVCTGTELINNLMQQIAPFSPTFHLGEEVTHVRKREDGCFDVTTSRGAAFITKTVFIAAGAGAFRPRTLKLDGIGQFEGSQLFYQVRNPEIFRGKRLVICGGGDSALDWALNLADVAESLVLLHRRDEFRAAPASVARMRALCDDFRMQSLTGQITGFETADGRLSEIRVTGADGVTRRVPLDFLLVFYGLSPQPGPVEDWGLEMERRQIVVDTGKFETSIPGIFAVGDINIYPGKKKLILSGFHETALAAFAAAPYIFPEKKVHLQYTTTSPKLHKVLGVETPRFD